MSESQRRARTEELGSIFVSVTGGETVTEEQDDNPTDRELDEEDTRLSEAVDDGLDEAVAGAEPDRGDPGEIEG
jgi:hypothetical protein